jgi:hypothetical protein
VVATRGTAVESSDEVGHGPQECQEVPGPGAVAERGTAAARLADTRRSARGDLAGTGGEAAAGARAASDHAAGLAAERLPRAVSDVGASNPGATGAALESGARAREGDLLRAGARAGPIGGVGLHAHEQPGRDDRGGAVRPSAVPFRADALELGVRNGLLRGELREPERWHAECVLGIGRRSRGPSHGSNDAGGACEWTAGGVHGSLSRIAGALRGAWRSDEPGERPRERGLRAEPPAFQGSGGPGVDAAGQPRLRESGGVREIPAGVGAAA